MYGCEIWTIKNWHFWTVVLENTLESSLDSKEMQPVNPKGNQSWIYIGRPDVEAEALIFWPSDTKNRCFWVVVLEKTLESPLDSKEIKLVNPKGNQPWIFLGRTDAEAPILWPPDAKSWLIGKDPDAVKDWGQEEKQKTEDEMVGWHHWLWTWIWASFRKWWRTGKPGLPQFIRSRTWLSNWTTTVMLEKTLESPLDCKEIKPVNPKRNQS